MIALLLSLTLGPHAYDASWIECYDGDTCRFNIHLGLNHLVADQTVRLCDIDTPELRGAEREAGLRSRDALRERLRQGQRIQVLVAQKADCNRSVSLDCDKHDSFGRWLAYIVADGENLNEWLLREGWAEEYPKKCEE